MRDDNPNNRWSNNPHADEVLVFVHGILSDSRKCWLDEKSGAYWPDLVAKDQRFHDAGIYLGGYHTAVDSADFSIQDGAAELFNHLQVKDEQGNAPVLSKKKITFICHSMGGVVVRYLLCQHHERFKDKTVGLVLIASPSYGSRLQGSLAYLIHAYNHQQGRQLKWGGELLDELDRDFKQLRDKKRIPALYGMELLENLFIVRAGWLPWLKREKVVENQSAARYFGASMKVGGSDHMSICKPGGPTAEVHVALYAFLSEHGLLPASRATLATPAPAAPPAPAAVDSASLVAELLGADPVKGNRALAALLDRGDAAEQELFSTELAAPTTQALRRLLMYVSARPATVAARLLDRLRHPSHPLGDALAASLLAGVPDRADIATELHQQLTQNFVAHFSLQEQEGAAARLLALGHAGGYAGAIAAYVDHDKYAWEKLAPHAFRGACAALVRGRHQNHGAVARLLVQTGPSQQRRPSPDIADKEVSNDAISSASINDEVYHRAFALRQQAPLVDHVLRSWSGKDTHWRVRQLGAGIVASAGYGRTVPAVSGWLAREPDPDVRSHLLRALGSADTAAAADALLAHYRQSEGGEGGYDLSRCAWRCTDQGAALQELERLAARKVEQYPAALVSLARLGAGRHGVEAHLHAGDFFVRAHAALAIGYLQDLSQQERLLAQLKEASAPVERICIAAALLMLDHAIGEGILHRELVAASAHHDLQLRIDPYFLQHHLKQAILDAFPPDSLLRPLWQAEFQPLP